MIKDWILASEHTVSHRRPHPKNIKSRGHSDKVSFVTAAKVHLGDMAIRTLFNT